MKRDDVSSWLEGQPQQQGSFRGARLGLPEAGPGSMAGLGRRSVALVIDWWASWLVAYLLWGTQTWGTLGIFAAQNVILLAMVGSTFGHRIAGLSVIRCFVTTDPPTSPEDSSASAATTPSQAGIGLVPALIRTALLCLVLPAVVWDGDGRGLHDRGAGTAIVRR